MRFRYRDIAAACIVASLILSGTVLLYRSETARLIQNERLSLLQQVSTLSARLETAVSTRIDISHALATLVAGCGRTAVANPDDGRRWLVDEDRGASLPIPADWVVPSKAR